MQENTTKKFKLFWWLLSAVMLIIPSLISCIYTFSEPFYSCFEYLAILWVLFVFPSIPAGLTKGTHKICEAEWENRLRTRNWGYFLRRYVIVWMTVLFLFAVSALYKILSSR